jgi:hypothetical protein
LHTCTLEDVLRDHVREWCTGDVGAVSRSISCTAD